MPTSTAVTSAGRHLDLTADAVSMSAPALSAVSLSERSPAVLLSELEYRSETAQWSLSVLLSPLALSVELLVRVIGLLLCEAKIIVIGEHYVIYTPQIL